MRVERYLEQLATQAVSAVAGEPAPALLRPAKDARHGDFQINGVLAIAKKRGENPRGLAEPVAERLAAADAIERAEVAGPGFVNLHLSPTWLGSALAELAQDRERDGVPRVEDAETIVVDYSAPNVAKEMHVGHLRSTILGAALCEILRFVGHRVIGDNHVGDYGTQYGLLIVGMREFGSDETFEQAPLAELERIYRLATERAKGDAGFAEVARAELAKLQQGDPENRALWERFVEITRRALDGIYARLGVEFDLWRGESAYEAMLPEVVEELLSRGIAREDQGAICVFFDDEPGLKDGAPFIVRKKDGAYLYSTTDLATLRYRRDELAADRCLYVVDQRQSLHFKQLFATAAKLGFEMQLEHVGFGTILGKDGKPFKAREGESVKLAALLDEAEQRAGDLMQSAELDVSLERVPELARSVGIGAVKYADLSQNRLSDYRFDWNKMVSLKGNAGPYLQYAHARVCSIFRRGEVEPSSLLPTSDEAQPLVLESPAEIALGKQLLRFADAVYQAAETSYPHVIAEHLYALARAYSVFFEQCPVLKSAEPTRTSRLTLSWLTARQLRRGLSLLGIDAPERM